MSKKKVRKGQDRLGRVRKGQRRPGKVRKVGGSGKVRKCQAIHPPLPC